MDIPGILRAQALSLRVQADRMEDLASMVESGEIPANSKVVVDLDVHPEARIRNILSDVPSMTESNLATKLGESRSKVHRLMLPLVANRKVGRISHGGGEYAYAWLAPDEDDPGNPDEAPRSSPSPTSAPGGVQVASERGKPVRIRTTRKMGKRLSTPGSRGHAKRQEQAYTRQQDAQARRQEAQKAKKEMTPTAAARKRENQERAEQNKARKGAATAKGTRTG